MSSSFSHDENNESFAELFAAQDDKQQNKRLAPGDRVQAVIIAVSGESVFLDVGIKLDGIMEKKDILDAAGESVAGVGDTIEAWVTGVTAQEIRLSRSMSGSGAAALEDARDNAIPVEGRVTGTCKGGYLVETLGKSAFCPGSQMDAASLADPDNLTGRTLQFLVTRVENRGRNIVLSRRALLDRERRESLEKLLAEIKPGDELEGTVTRLAPYGVFVSLAPSVEGMVHISELSWSRLAHPEEIVQPGEHMKVKVLSWEQDAKGVVRISLSRKQAQDDPWTDIESRISTGQVMQGKVTRLAPFGAFVELFPGVEGLVHISELSFSKRIRHAEEVVNTGDSVRVTIKEIFPEKRRLSLSLRDAGEDPWTDVAERFPVGTPVRGTVEQRASFGLFIELAPGVTGLMPNALIASSKKASNLAKLTPGESVDLFVQALNNEQRRITLAPEDCPANEDQGWKRYNKGIDSAGNLGIMAQALQNAQKVRE